LFSLDKIGKDLDDAARRRNSTILCWHINKLRGSSKSGVIPVKEGKGVRISDNERVKLR
jgi:hypothetical protein